MNEPNPIRVEIGTHFAVMEYDDGTVEMYWDDDKLLEEVRECTRELPTVEINP